MSKEVDERLEAQKKANKRTGLILLSVALVFFFGIVVRKVFEPSILNLMN